MANEDRRHFCEKSHNYRTCFLSLYFFCALLFLARTFSCLPDVTEERLLLACRLTMMWA